MNLTEHFAGFVEDIRYAALDQQTVQTAKQRLLDTIGAMVAGCAGWPYSGALCAAVKELGGGRRSPIGPYTEGGVPAARAAMLNGTFAHALELDDGHKYAGVHAGAVIVPTALAVGQEVGASGAEVLAAIVAGYELVYRLASAQSPDLIDRGFHPSAVCGTVGAMAAAGKLMKLSRTQLANGLGMAALQAAGLMEATVSGQQSKCIMVGNAAFNGISCACLAKENIEGCSTAFEGEKGLFSAMSKRLNPERLLEGLGERYLIEDTYSKFYPTCRHAQPAIEGVLLLSREHGISPKQVERIEVGTYQVACDLTGHIKSPKNAGEAKFSIAYGAAAALLDGCFSITHLREANYASSKYLELAQRVDVVLDGPADRLYPKRRGARVEILMRDGTRLQKDCYDLKGSPDNPASLEELIDKFRANAQGLLSDGAVESLLERCGCFEQEADLESFMALLRWEREK
ncbi:hypothetical protein N510_000751 [Firmicutes bacterium ASF500]|nr:hypothetical protein N510_000751 [Firmicutes bacterium ASF500]